MCASVTTLMARSPQPSGDRAIKNPRMRRVASISPGPTQKETYYSVKRDLLQCQKRPTTVSIAPFDKRPPPPVRRAPRPQPFFFLPPRATPKPGPITLTNSVCSVQTNPCPWSVHASRGACTFKTHRFKTHATRARILRVECRHNC
jgi:hypothetical protein